MKEADLLRADRELGRFVRYQYAEFLRVSYPRMSAFAKDIARGTIQPLTAEDPLMEVDGAFYRTLTAKEKAVLSWKYLRVEKVKVMAKRLGVAPQTLYDTFGSIRQRCANYLVKYT